MYEKQTKDFQQPRLYIIIVTTIHHHILSLMAILNISYS